MSIGIIRERKNPPDERVPFSPNHCLELKKIVNGNVSVESSPIRKFKDAEYAELGIEVTQDVSNCDVLFGVKEVPVAALIPNKTYFFFSHTIKQQPYNRDLLRSVLEKNIRLVDYECLTSSSGNRLVGFGKYAGMVGAYNGLRTYGLKNDIYDLKPAYECHDANDMWSQLTNFSAENIRIVLTGSGRVAEGAMMTLGKAGVRQVSITEFLEDQFNEPVFVQLRPRDYFQRFDGKEGNVRDIIKNPKEYRSDFMRYANKCDLFIAGHYWEAPSPFIFTREDAASPDFNIQVVADISCDIDGPVASTIRPSTIENPIYGYNPQSQSEEDFKKDDVIAVMAVDNLPCELPRDASEGFGEELLRNVIPCLLGNDPENIIDRATIAKDGQLMPDYTYLESYVAG